MISLMSHKPITVLETWLDKSMPLSQVARGESLFRAGEKPLRMVWVKQGELHLVRHGAQGERTIVQRCTRGLLAEAALFSECYHCEGIAAADTVYWSLPRKRFLDALADPALSRAYIAWLSQSVRNLRGQCERLSLPRAEDRVLHALRETGHYDLNAGTLKNWAATLGMTHEHLYRTLAGLVRDGRIRRDAFSVRLVDN